ncbi:Protein CSF1 [Golovinomyces cichoracearum]|uniref:Protein CSF1 n=1 Tax=Golovinomyces cichoracearum TaxID=62708 RepID=A0A420HBC2_9PEZI|nr:Protein CSF1 [Golovinomyces cichoracearum]
MSSSAMLKNSPLRHGFEFNWIFLIQLIVCGVLVLAAVLSYGIRIWTWHKYRIYFDVKSFQVSLLAGRVFFKEFRYHGNNETILIQSGYVTWRYWLRNFRQLSINRGNTPEATQESPALQKEGKINNNGFCKGERIEEEASKSHELPCRLVVSVKGVEWFLYNRSLAYDAIALNLAQENAKIDHDTSNLEEDLKFNSDSRDKQNCNVNGVRDSSASETYGFEHSAKEKQKNTHQTEHNSSMSSSSQIRNRGNHITSQLEEKSPFALRLLPIEIKCEKAAVVAGNHNSQSVLIVKIEKAAGKIDASNSPSKLDMYKQLVKIHFEHPTVRIRPNNDYKDDQTSSGSCGKLNELMEDQQKQHIWTSFRRQFQRRWRYARNKFPNFQESVSSSSALNQDSVEIEARPCSNSWQGLSRYLDENRQDSNYKWCSIEYARVSTILESLSAEIELYWDSAGIVQEGNLYSEKNRERFNNINGDVPPEWGINLSFGAAIVNYGPWADRQRADIQRIFFPSLCKDAIPPKNLAPGQLRVATEFKMNIEFDEKSVLRIPTKEESKNWKWSKLADSMSADQITQKKNTKNGRKNKSDTGNHGPKSRPFGWLDLRFGAHSTIKYFSDIYAGSAGIKSQLEIDLPTAEITTSVNHGLLWKSTQNRISCDLSQPLKWNGLRTWKFDIRSKNLELFILREHAFLLTDLIDDWTNGPPQDFFTFCPFKYLISLHLEDFRIFFNVNDSNIINNPSDMDDNTYIVLSGVTFDANISIPLQNYRPHHNDLPFDIEMENIVFNLHVPTWNTQATFLDSNELGTLKNLNFKGKFQYCSITSSSNTDTFLIDIICQSLSANTYGFAIRLLLKIKDNYFGEDFHFKTLEEYQKSLNFQGRPQKLPKPPHRSSNDLDIIMSIYADHCNLNLPSNLYSASKSICIDITDVATDLRFNNYYMDYELDFSTISFSQNSETHTHTHPTKNNKKIQLLIDSLSLYENRLFGLPPAEPTYICNRDFSVGAITGECTTEFLRQLICGSNAFLFSLDDVENALPSSPEQSHEITFLRASLQSCHVWLHVDSAAFFLSTEKVSINFNDWAGPFYSKKLKISIPGLKFGCVNTDSTSRQKSSAQNPVKTDALIQSAISIVMIEKNPNFEEGRQLQQEHIQRHDERTHRCNFLFHENLPYMSTATSIKPPTLKPPQMPVPVFRGDSLSFQNKFESRNPSSSFRAGRKSSFLSLKNSIAESLVPENLFGNNSKEIDPGFALAYSKSRKYHSPKKNSLFDESLNLCYPDTESSSSQRMAKFPLEGIEPDTSDLPEIHIDSKEKLFVSDFKIEPQNHRSGASKKKGLHTSYMISFTDPIRGFSNNQAINAATELFSSMQAASPNDFLDELQINSLKEVIDDTKDKLLEGTTFDLRLRISSLSLRFLNPTTILSKENESYDQIDLSMSGLSVTFRSENTMKLIEANRNIEKSFVFIMRISSVTLAAKEKFPDMRDVPATISCFLDDLTSWVNSGKETIARIKIKGFELVTPSCKFRHVASLLNRTKFFSNKILEKISSLSKQQETRILLFTYLVAIAGQQRTEPLFLTRPSYVLRSATGHLRTQVSWIIISRLHHTYNCLDPSTQCDIASRSLKISENLPKDAKNIILASLARWRSWDPSNVDNCVIMSKIFCSRRNSVWISDEFQSFRLLLETKLCRLVVDPGPKQNALSIFQLSVNFEKMVSPPYLKSSTQANNHVTPLVTIELLIEDLSMFLNWELYEMIREIVKISDQNRCSQDILTTKKSKEDLEISESELGSNIHFILAIHKTSLQVDTINLISASFMNEMKASYLLTYDEKIRGQRISSFIIFARTATSSVKSHSQELGLVQLRSPSIYVSYQEENDSDMSENIIKTAANCHKLDFIIKQDIAALMEVLNLLVVDEMAQLYELTSIKSHSSSTNLKSNTDLSDMNLIPEVSIALFLDRYHISLQLLQSLTYDIFGNVARASFTSQLNRKTIFDFDVKDHTHEMTTSNDQDGISSISLLNMPSINGRVTLLMAGNDAALSIFASIEPIILDAAVVHTILTTINRPEVLDMIENVRNDAENIKSQLHHIFNGKSPGDVINSTPKKRLFYDAHLTLAGFGIVTDALTTDESQKTAKLDFNLGCIQLVAMSSDDNSRSVDKYPQLCISLHKVTIELTRWDINKSLEPCGGLSFAAFLKISSKTDSNGYRFRNLHFKGSHLKINLFSKSASTVLDVLGHMQDKIKNIDLSRENNYLQKLRKSHPQIIVGTREGDRNDSISTSAIFSQSIYSLELINVKVSWLVGQYGKYLPLGVESEDLVLSLRRMNFSSRKQDSAQLIIEDLQLQMVPNLKNKSIRSLNSALLPKVMFDVKHVSTENSRRLAFQAGGKLLDIRLTPRFMIPASALKKSIVSAIEEFRKASNNWKLLSGSHRQQPFLGKKNLESLLIDADFAGAVVHLSGKCSNSSQDTSWSKSDASQESKFGKFANNDLKSTSSITVLRSPRLACKIEYKDRGADDLSLNAEVKVDASSNIIYPSVVPIIMEISSIVKEIVSEEEIKKSETKLDSHKSTNTDETNLLNTKPSTVLDRTKLNLGLRICRQEFGLSCQPIARVAATTQFEDIYIAINTVQYSENDQFFAASAKITGFKASVQHVYSREATGSFDIESVILSLMNSKHVGSTNGIAAILKTSPVKLQLNAKQLHNFLLFREIWMPQEIRQRPQTPPPHFSSPQAHNILVQRYQQVAATSAFPWNATVLISGLEMQLDLGQAIGKSAFTISKIWFSSKKNSAWEQSVCLGIEEVTVQSTGRLSGRFTLLDFKLRTSIQWPAGKLLRNQTPLVQGSIVFKRLSLKAAFDYYAFLISEIESLHFLMYNACSEICATDDQLMAILEAEAVQIFCTTTSSSHVLALYQAVQKLIQEKRTNFATSLSEIENFLNRTSTISTNLPQNSNSNIENEVKTVDSPISLHTNVIVMMRAVNIGIFPTTFLDHQVFKLEALNIKSRFGVTMDDGKIHSILGLNLGQLRIGLAGVKTSEISKSLGDISVEDVVKRVVGSRGGTILKVPTVESTMQTWQVPKSNRIEYIFKSSFGGKVEVGWNYSRISYIRGMWATHSKALAQRLGKPLPLSAVRITGVPDGDQLDQKDGEQRKITAEVNVPVSRYYYIALEAPIIETPQLRDMGEATPPLEWIGLHRDRLPNLTHQIVIVTLLELVAQIEEAYVKILGSP